MALAALILTTLHAQKADKDWLFPQATHLFFTNALKSFDAARVSSHPILAFPRTSFFSMKRCDR